MFEELLLNVNTYILNPLIFLMIGVAALTFVFGVVQYIIGSEDETKRTAGRNHMLWGVIGLFIMLSVFGIIELIAGSIGVEVIESI